MAYAVPTLDVKRSSSFIDDLMLNLYNMKTHATMTDFTIKVHNVIIPCHSVIMASASPYFRVLLNSSMKEVTQRHVQLDYLNKQYLQKVVDYCYTGQITIELDSALKCLEIVDYFQLLRLKTLIEDFICEHISPKTCIGWYDPADKFHLVKLKQQAKSMMIASFLEVIQHQEFKQLTLSEMIDYIEEDDLVTDGDSVLAACMNWVMFDVNVRHTHLVDILPHARLHACSPSMLKSVLKTVDKSWLNFGMIQEIITSVIIDSIPDQQNKAQTTSISEQGHHKAPSRVTEPQNFPYQQSSSHDIITSTCQAEKQVKPEIKHALSILVAGGIGEKDVLNRKLWKMDLLTGNCVLLGTMPHYAVKYNAAVTAIPEGMLFAGGSTSFYDPGPTDTCTVLNTSKLTWSSLPDLKVSIESASAVYLDNSIYCLGGSDEQNDLMFFDLRTRKWKFGPQMRKANDCPIVGAIAHKIHVIDNTDIINPRKRLAHQCFDTRTKKWTFLHALPSAINESDGACLITVEDYLFLVGGVGRICARYSPSNDMWDILQKPHELHCYGSAIYANGQIFLCGGGQRYGLFNDIIEVYDIKKGTWAVSEMKLPVPLCCHLCALV